MAIKRKAVHASADNLFKKKAPKKTSPPAEEEEELEDVQETTGTKKTTVSEAKLAKQRKKKASKATPPTAEEEEEMEDVQEKKTTVSEAKLAKQREQELSAARQSELKSLAADAIKQLVLDKGLEPGGKSDNIEKILKAEAKDRRTEQEHQAECRALLIAKKEELQALSVSDLVSKCNAIGIKATTKQERVESFLKHWLENNGIKKALALKAYVQRKDELLAMDSHSLLKLCNKMNVDAFVSEVMADRVIRCEVESGRFKRPMLDETKAELDKEPQDIVDALLTSEASRAKQLEEKKKEEEQAAEKLKEFRALSKEDLEKRMKKKGLEVTGKKEELVAALFVAFNSDRKLEARKTELKSMGKNGLKDLCLQKGLATSPTAESMIKAVLDHDAQRQKELKAYDAVAEEIVAKKREELMQKSSAELKEMLEAKDLKAGVGKEERVDRLLECMRKNGEIDKVVFTQTRDKRRTELVSMDKKSLRMLCGELGANAFVKELAIERILDAEMEAKTMGQEPHAKRAKK